MAQWLHRRVQRLRPWVQQPSAGSRLYRIAPIIGNCFGEVMTRLFLPCSRCFLAACAGILALRSFAADTGVWKVAPPPPLSWQRDRVADLSARRRAVMDQMGEHGVLMLYAAEPRNYANDVDWPFRQENDFFYLTGLRQGGATLVLVPGAGKIHE